MSTIANASKISRESRSQWSKTSLFRVNWEPRGTGKKIFIGKRQPALERDNKKRSFPSLTPPQWSTLLHWDRSSETGIQSVPKELWRDASAAPAVPAAAETTIQWSRRRYISMLRQSFPTERSASNPRTTGLRQYRIGWPTNQAPWTHLFLIRPSHSETGHPFL